MMLQLQKLSYPAVRKEMQRMRDGGSPTQKQVISLRKAHSTVNRHPHYSLTNDGT